MSPHLLPILLTLFEGLGWAYTAKAEEDGSDDEGDDDEEDDDAQLADAAARGIDVEELENLEDEEDYDESEVHRIASELAFNLEDMGNDEFEEGQFSRFRTLIDTKEKDPAFDEYGAFMRVLDGKPRGERGRGGGGSSQRWRPLSCRLGSFFEEGHGAARTSTNHWSSSIADGADFSQRGILASAMSNLTPEQGETLQEVKTEAEKRAVGFRWGGAAVNDASTPSFCPLPSSLPPSPSLPHAFSFCQPGAVPVHRAAGAGRLQVWQPPDAQPVFVPVIKQTAASRLLCIAMPPSPRFHNRHID